MNTKQNKLNFYYNIGSSLFAEIPADKGKCSKKPKKTQGSHATTSEDSERHDDAHNSYVLRILGITSHEFELVIKAYRLPSLLPYKVQEIRIIFIYKKRKRKNSTVLGQNKLHYKLNIPLLDI